MIGTLKRTAGPYEIFKRRQSESAKIAARTSRLLAKADEIAGKCLVGEMTSEQAMLPIGAILHDLSLLYRKILKYKPPVLVAKPRRGVVYVMRAEDGLCKIGQTSSIKKRHKAIQSSSSVPVKVILCKRAGRWARDAEQHLHETFASKRVRGEWFALDTSDIEMAGPVLSAFLAGEMRAVHA